MPDITTTSTLLTRGLYDPLTGLYFWGRVHGSEQWVDGLELMSRRDKDSKYSARYAASHAEVKRAKRREYYKVHVNPLVGTQGPRTSACVEGVKERRAIYRKQWRAKHKLNPCYRIMRSVRHRLRNALKRKVKIFHSIDLIGCDVSTLKSHLESKFQLGMEWSNYGYGQDKWHIDHIKRCREFDLSDPSQQKICFHWSNLQPLWQHDNLSKN